jgi:hypothetical protein
VKALLLASLIAGTALPALAYTPAAVDTPSVVPVQRANRHEVGDITAVLATCSALMQTAKQIGSVPLLRLDQLPPGMVEHAVLRTIAGCPVREIVWHGQTYYVAPTSPPVLDAEPLRGSRIKQR